MTFPGEVIQTFAAAEEAIRQSPWFNGSWGCCSGLWKTNRYPDTVVLRLTRNNWTSVFPPTLDEGGDIQYAAWIDRKLLRKSTVRFEMHLFSFPGRGKIRKKNFTDPFRKQHEAVIAGFGHHDTARGHAIPYAGDYRYSSPEDLTAFIVRDFSNFASLSGRIDNHLSALDSELDQERREWGQLRAQGLARAYREDEPDYK